MCQEWKLNKEKFQMENLSPYSLYYNSHLLFTTIWWPSRMGQQNTLTASLQKGKNSLNERHEYNTKQSDDETPIIMELSGMQSTPSLPSLPGPPRPGVVAPERVLSVGQIELNSVIMLN